VASSPRQKFPNRHALFSRKSVSSFVNFLRYLKIRNRWRNSRCSRELNAAVLIVRLNAAVLIVRLNAAVLIVRLNAATPLEHRFERLAVPAKNRHAFAFVDGIINKDFHAAITVNVGNGGHELR
jgi:hypothetical protein